MQKIRVFPLLFLCLVLLGTVPAASQEQGRQGRVQGVVLNEDEEPVQGAEVRLSPMQDSGVSPKPVTTDSKGRWSVNSLAVGRWRINIAAEGYINSEGWVQASRGSGPPVEVMLRPLTQALPGFAENPSAIYAWIEKGNSLLEQGRPAEARAEYERALRTLPTDQQPEVLRTVARTYYLEQNNNAAVNALKRALLFAPRDLASRQLFNGVLDGLGQGDEAKAWLARLDAEGPGALAPETPQPAGMPGVSGRPAEDIAPTLEPAAGRIGVYRMALTERGALSALDVYLKRHQAKRSEILKIDADAAGYDISRETFEVVVPPKDNDPPEKAYGLLVWVSPTPSGKVRRPDNLEALASRGVIWIGANGSGNQRAIWDRVGLALDAVHGMKKLYSIDDRRIYVGGYSGGGRISTALSVLYPEVFQGGMLFMGCDYYKKVPLPDRPGAHWPAAFPEPSGRILKLARERNRYVFATGENDFNRMQTRIFYRHYRQDGFRNVSYLEIPGASHYAGFDGEWLGKFLDFLDSTLD